MLSMKVMHALFSHNIPLNCDFCSLPNLAVFREDNLLALNLRPMITTFADGVFCTGASVFECRLLVVRLTR